MALGQVIGEADPEKWLDLDRLLIQFWESRSIRTKVISRDQDDVGDYIQCLLPEATNGGVIDIIE
jgi:hypothetical protein